MANGHSEEIAEGGTQRLALERSEQFGHFQTRRERRYYHAREIRFVLHGERQRKDANRHACRGGQNEDEEDMFPHCQKLNKRCPRHSLFAEH